jgi:4-oxalocrotonate tautomerase
MPIITVENAGKLSREQKTKLIEKLTKVVVEETGKPAQYVYVKIEEVPVENFGIGGKSLG